MKIRALYGFRLNNKFKLLISHRDSRPKDLGQDVVVFINQLRSGKKIKTLKEKVQRLQVEYYRCGKEPTELPFFRLQGILNEKTQIIENGYSEKSECDFIYIINLDDMTFDVYQKGPMRMGRFKLDKIPKNWDRVFGIKEDLQQ